MQWVLCRTLKAGLIQNKEETGFSYRSPLTDRQEEISCFSSSAMEAIMLPKHKLGSTSWMKNYLVLRESRFCILESGKANEEWFEAPEMYNINVFICPYVYMGSFLPSSVSYCLTVIALSVRERPYPFKNNATFSWKKCILLPNKTGEKSGSALWLGRKTKSEKCLWQISRAERKISAISTDKRLLYFYWKLASYLRVQTNLIPEINYSVVHWHKL